jgi:L-alanine-DL-glutamate epimerase-like enolase superfamily enzyme
MSSGDLMQVSSLKTFLVDLPFRLSFGHNLAKRKSSTNVFVKVVVRSGSVDYAGLGESVPRDYVSGECAPTCWRYLNDVLFPQARGLTFDTLPALAFSIEEIWNRNNLDSEPHGASFCALELALFDAFCRAENIPFYELPNLLAAALPDSFSASQSSTWPNKSGQSDPALFVNYGGVVPFGGGAFLSTILNFYKAYGFGTVKLKVGSSLEDNLFAVSMARRILPPEVKLRIDANCAWDLDAALRQLEALRPMGIISVEEPLAKGDLKNLAKLKAAVPEKIIADESLTTLEEGRTLIEMDAVSGFNVRLSKLGGLLASMKLVELAYKNNIEVHLGAQVGESGVLASAQRHFAGALSTYENVEGAMNIFLLQRDITKQCLTVPFGGRARVSREAGLGVSLSRAGERYLGHFPPSFAAPAYAMTTPHKLTYALRGSK